MLEKVGSNYGLTSPMTQPLTPLATLRPSSCCMLARVAQIGRSPAQLGREAPCCLRTALGVAPRVSLKLLAKGLQLFNDFGECRAAARGAQHAPARPYIASNRAEAFLQIFMQACHPSDMYSEMFTVRPTYSNDYEATLAHDLEGSRTLMKGSLHTISCFCCSVG